MKLKLSFLWKKRWWEESHWPTASSSLCYSFPLVLIHSGLSALLWDYRRDCPTSPKSSPMQFLYKTEPLRWMQTWKQLISNALIVHLKTTKLPSANVLKHFHKLPGSLPAQPPRPAGAVGSLSTELHSQKDRMLLSDSASPWQRSWANLMENQEPLTHPDFARSQVHGQTQNLEALELRLQNTLQDVTNMKYSNSTNFTAALQYWQQQSYWLRRTASMKKNPYTQKSNCKTELLRMYFFFPSGTKNVKKYTEVILKHKLLLILFIITIMFCRGLILPLPNARLHFSQNAFSRTIPLNLAEALLLQLLFCRCLGFFLNCW